MYIDKLYTKLFSERDWNGLAQLVNEIRQFNYKQMGGMNSQDKYEHQVLRDQVAKYVRENRNKPGTLDKAHATLARDKAMRKGASQRELIDSVYTKGGYGGYNVTPDSYWKSVETNPDADIKDMQVGLVGEAINKLGDNAKDRYTDDQMNQIRYKIGIR